MQLFFSLIQQPELKLNFLAFTITTGASPSTEV